VIKAILYFTLAVNKIHPLVKIAIATGKAYNTTVKKAGPKHKLGSPHLHIFAAWIRNLKRREELQHTYHSGKEEDDMTTLEAYTEKGAVGYNTISLEEEVKLAKCTKQYDEDWYTVQFSAPSGTESEKICKLLYAVIQEDGGIAKHNIAPKGPRERRLAMLLNNDRKEDNE